MLSSKKTIFIFLFCVIYFRHTDAWRRRRRRRCPYRDCEVTSWSYWSSCSAAQCGVRGVQLSTRHKIVTERCGGTCTSTFRKTRQCYGARSVDCRPSSWSEWSSCNAHCDVSGVQFSARHRIVTEQCGGSCTSTFRKTRQCYDTKSFDCQISFWSEWSPCSTTCGAGVEVSTRHKTVIEQCGGTCLSTFRKTRPCLERSCEKGQQKGKSQSGQSTAAIVGEVFGCLCVVVIGFVIYHCCCKNNRVGFN